MENKFWIAFGTHSGGTGRTATLMCRDSEVGAVHVGADYLRTMGVGLLGFLVKELLLSADAYSEVFFNETLNKFIEHIKFGGK